MTDLKSTTRFENLEKAREFFTNTPDDNFILITEKNGVINRISSMGGSVATLILDLAISSAIQPDTLDKLAKAVKVNMDK